jgi:hypothetical protein
MYLAITAISGLEGNYPDYTDKKNYTQWRYFKNLE